MSDEVGAVVALHGMLGEASDWEFLADDGVVGIDLWQYENEIDALELDARVAIGYSMGGRLLLHALDQLDAAVIVSAHTGLAEAGQREQRLENDQLWEEKARALPWSEFIREWHAQPVFEGGGFEPDRSGLEPRREQVAAAFDRWSLGRQEDLLPRLGELQIPVLWVNGALDEKFTAIGAAACERLAQGEHAVIDGCGHRVPWEAPEKFRDLTMRFLSRHSLCR